MKDAAGKLRMLLAEEMSRQAGAYIERDGWTNLLDQCRGGLAQIPVATMAVDGSEQEDKRLEHHVELDRTHYAGTRARYRVTYLGKTLIESTRDPEFDACRALAAKGIIGILVTYSPGSSVPRTGRYQQGCAADDHRQCQGRPSDRPLQTASEVH